MKKIYALVLMIISMPSLSARINYTDDPRLASLGSWPLQKPNLAPFEWSMFQNHSQLGSILFQNRGYIKLIVELGSWLGSSTRFILDQAPQAVVIAIDHWQGSAEHFAPPYSYALPVLYDLFLVNCWEYRHRLVPFRINTLDGLTRLHELGLKPDLFYVDASHDYRSVTLELEAIYALFPDAIICGDDWVWNDNNENFLVQRAVLDFVDRHNLIVEPNNWFWIIKK